MYKIEKKRRNGGFMLKKLCSLLLVIMMILSFVSCKKVIFESAYYKNGQSVYIEIPETSKVIAQYEADFDNDGNNERLDIILAGKDDANASSRPIMFEMFKKDFDGNMTSVNLIYPNDVNAPVIYDGFLSKDRIDVMVKETGDGVNIYFEESGISNHFGDFKSFYFTGYEFKNYNFKQIAEPVMYVGSYPDLYEANKLIKDYEDPNATEKIDKSDYEYLIRFKDKLAGYNLENEKYGYDYPVSEQDKSFKRVVRLKREESGVGNADKWYESIEKGPFGKVIIY